METILKNSSGTSGKHTVKRGNMKRREEKNMQKLANIIEAQIFLPIHGAVIHFLHFI